MTGQYVAGKGTQSGTAVDGNGKALPRNGWSGFVEGKLTKQWSLIGRYDEFNPNTDVGNDKTKRTIVGVAYKFGKRQRRSCSTTTASGTSRRPSPTTSACSSRSRSPSSPLPRNPRGAPRGRRAGKKANPGVVGAGRRATSVPPLAGLGPLTGGEAAPLFFLRPPPPAAGLALSGLPAPPRYDGAMRRRPCESTGCSSPAPGGRGTAPSPCARRTTGARSPAWRAPAARNLRPRSMPPRRRGRRWRRCRRTSGRRSCERAAAEVARRREELAQTIVEEAGKPLSLARVEAERCAETFAEAARVARSPHGELLDLEGFPSGAGRIGLLRRFPVGVVVGITPFNFPLNLVAHKLGAGRRGRLPDRAQAGVADALAGAAARPRSCTRPGCRSGGSTSCRAAAPTPRRCSTTRASGSSPSPARRPSAGSSSGQLWDRKVALELGGNAAVIVEPDAGDLEAVARRIAGGAFAYAGQSCISVQRVLVHEAIAARVPRRARGGHGRVPDRRPGAPGDVSAAR